MEAIETHHHRAMVFVGGDINVSPPLDATAFVVGCDSGYDHATNLGHHVDLLIGDLDSISDVGIASARALGVAVEQHPAGKDATDFELAIDACLKRGHNTIDIYGGEGGRLDHLLGLATALTAARWRYLTLRWHTGDGMTTPAVGPTEVILSVDPHTRISLIAVTDCTGVTSTGVAWSLENASLERGSSRGISNLSDDSSVTIAIASGALLISLGTQEEPQNIAHATEGSTHP